MIQKQLGKTKLKVSGLAFGTLTISPLQRNIQAEKGRDLILYAANKGINLFDTAQLYDTYLPLRLAFKKSPNIKVATKTYAWNKETAKAAFEEARKKLDKDHIDIFLLHEQESIHTMRGHREAFDFFLSEKDKGNIGAVGLSTHRVEVVRQALNYPGVDVIHPIINMAGIGLTDGSIEDMERACKLAHDSGIGIYAMKALGGGHLINDYEKAMSYVLGLSFIDSVAMGMQSEAEIDVNVAFFSGEKPNLSAINKARRTKRELWIHDWCTACGQCEKRCGQGAINVIEGRARVDIKTCILCGYCVDVCPEFCIKVI